MIRNDFGFKGIPTHVAIRVSRTVMHKLKIMDSPNVSSPENSMFCDKTINSIYPGIKKMRGTEKKIPTPLNVFNAPDSDKAAKIPV
jgi:hypothetical protein